MSKYVVSGFDESGRKRTEDVEANSAVDALQRFRDRGYEDVSLETDEIQAVVKDQFKAMRGGRPAAGEFTARETIAFAKLGGLGRFLFTARKLYTQSPKTIVTLIAIAALLRLNGHPVGIPDVLIYIGIATPALQAFFVTLFGSRNQYTRMIEDVSWCRWNDVLEKLPSLHGKLPPFEMSVYRAQALAGLGRLPEGLALLEPFSDGKQIPEWMYWGRLLSLYFAAGLPEKVIECLKNGLECSPKNPTLLLELAIGEVRFHRNPREAKAVLQQLDMATVTELMRSALETAEGLMALEFARSSSAIEHFQNALKISDRYAVSNPLAASGSDRLHAYLCLAYAQGGDLDEARRHFRKAEKRIRSFKLQDITERCLSALGRHAD